MRLLGLAAPAAPDYGLAWQACPFATGTQRTFLFESAFTRIQILAHLAGLVCCLDRDTRRGPSPGPVARLERLDLDTQSFRTGTGTSGLATDPSRPDNPWLFGGPCMAFLVSSTPPRLYGPGQLDQLSEDLTEEEKQLQLTPVQSLQDVTFRTDGRSLTQWHWTRYAIIQLCRLLCPGLYRAIAYLAGWWGRPSEGADLRNALALLNQLTAQRYYTVLQNKLLLRHIAEQQVRGIVSHSYHWFSQKAFWEELKRFWQAQPERPALWGAWWDGPDFWVRYYWPKRLLGPREDRFVWGWSFANHECNARALTVQRILVRTEGKEVATSAPVQRRIHRRHRYTAWAAVWRKAIQQTWSPQRTVNQLVRLDNIIWSSQAPSDLPRLLDRATLDHLWRNWLAEGRQQPTLYDFYLGLGKLAQQGPYRRRDGLERLAWDLLEGGHKNARAYTSFPQKQRPSQRTDAQPAAGGGPAQETHPAGISDAAPETLGDGTHHPRSAGESRQCG